MQVQGLGPHARVLFVGMSIVYGLFYNCSSCAWTAADE